MDNLFEELTNPYTGLPGADRAALVEIVARVRTARKVYDRLEAAGEFADSYGAFRQAGVLDHILAAVPASLLSPAERDRS